MQEKLKKAYSLSQNQKKMAALVAKHSDDKAAYAKALEPLLAEVEARKVLLGMGMKQLLHACVSAFEHERSM